MYSISKTHSSKLSLSPLNRIGLPFYDTELLSYYDSPLLPSSTAVAPPQKIPPQVLSAVRVQDHLSYAILPKELRGQRNVVKAAPKKKTEGRFRSELARRHDDVSLLTSQDRDYESN